MEFLSNEGVNALGDKLRSALSEGDRPSTISSYCTMFAFDELKAFLSHLRDAQSEIHVLRSRYRDKETTLAESSRWCCELKRAERMRDGIASEIKELCHE